MVTPVAATDLVTSVEPPSPSAPPIFYVHAGALGGFPQVNAQPTGGGLFGVANVAIRPSYTLDLETGYFVTPNIAIAVSAAVPPIEHFKATGFPQAGVFGSNLLGSTRAGLAMLLLQYHFTQFGAIQPYAGIGGGYIVNLGNISDGILTNFSLDQNFAFVLQAGAELMLTPNWGLYVDGKKEFLSTDAQGFVPTVVGPPVRVRAHVTLDPWRASAGITFKY
ncbi:MAG: outer membrane beta-barrel protein [Pseudomonadota bacterium]|nr:outer membrane beta-barrel protein [Pseudomonadota bacterium]